MMSTRRLAMWILFLGIFAMSARISMDNDTWWHLRAGEWILENQKVPQTDPFSYTRNGEAWQYPGWLVEVPMSWIYRLAGPGGMNVWTAAMVTMSFICLWPALSGGVYLRAFSLVLAAAVSGVYWAARPYLVTFLFAAAFLTILEEFRWKRRNLLWLLPIIMVLWANSHGGFAVGWILIIIYLTGELVQVGFAFILRNQDETGGGANRSFQWNRLGLLAGVGVLCVLAVGVNPSGFVMLAYPFKTVSIGVLQDYIQEWQTPNFHSLQVQPFAWMLLLLIGVLGLSRRRVALVDFLLAAGFTYLGLMAGRNVALFGLAAPIVLTRHAQPLIASIQRLFGWKYLPESHPTPPQNRLNWLILCLVLVAVVAKVALVMPVRVNETVINKNLPVGAVDYLKKTLPEGNLFNPYNWGGYLLWALPEYPVFVDGRTDLYNDDILNQWMQITRAEEGWLELINRYDIRIVLTESGSALDRGLASEGWLSGYRDELAVVYLAGIP